MDTGLPTTPDAPLASGLLPDASLVLRKVDLASLGDEAGPEYLAYDNRLRAESHPDDPPRTLEDQLAGWRNVPKSVEIHHWEARDPAAGGILVGRGHLQILHQAAANAHMAAIGIAVLPERRREGIARRLLRPIADYARERGRTLLISETDARIPAGERFLEAVGAQRGLSSHTNQLVVADVDRASLRAYREESARRGGGAFELVRCDSPIAEEWLVPVSALMNAVSDDVPFGDMNLEPFHFTAEQVGEFDRARLASGGVAFRLVAREVASGEMVGLTEMNWRKHAAYVAHQGITGVLPAYRGRGLARLLKAAMLEHLMDERPEVRFVRTENADSNAGILAINSALGFRPYRSETLWQVPTDRVLAYLAAR